MVYLHNVMFPMDADSGEIDNVVLELRTTFKLSMFTKASQANFEQSQNC